MDTGESIKICLWARQWPLCKAQVKLRLLACLAPASSATMFDKPDMAKIEKIVKSKLKTEAQEKNPVPSKEALEQMKQAGELQ